MKKILVGFMLMLTMLFTSTAFAETYVEVKGFGVYNIAKDVVQNNDNISNAYRVEPGFGVSLGYAFENVPLRVNLEYALRNNFKLSKDLKTLSNQTVMLQAFYDFKFSQSPFVPYIGAAGGLSILKDNNDFVFGPVVGVYAPVLNDKLFLDASYRYLMLGDWKNKVNNVVVDRAKINTHEISLALRYMF